jgi:para-aminobenzoate synthetase component 1
MQLPAWAQDMNALAASRVPFLFVLDFDLRMPLVIRLDQLESNGIRYALPRSGWHASSDPDHSPITPLKAPVSFEQYRECFNQVVHALQAGDSYLLNLCFSTRIEGVPSLEEIFERASAQYKLLVPGKFVLFSPESFIQIRDHTIRTFPMKGTIDASIPGAEMLLLEDIKEQEEHATVVDLLRNDLSIVSRHVKVDRYRYITTIETAEKKLLQCSTAISGILEEEYRDAPGSIMHAILPAGSVTGAPKKRTVELIHAIEPEPRGYYTGVFGVHDGRNLDSAVMIRMIEKRAEGYYYRSGGGITYRSEAQKEYQEMIDKVYVPIS